ASTGTTSDNSGNYSLAVAPGDYRIFAYGSSLPTSLNAPSSYTIYNNPTPLSLSQNTTLDLQLPAKRVSVHVQDPAGNPFANVRLQTTDPGNNNLMLAGFAAAGDSQTYNIYTNATGDATLWLFPTCSSCSYSITAYPPSATPFATFTIHDVTLTSDKSIVIVL